MDIREQFKFNQSIDLTAAHIGINRWQWATIDNDDASKARNFMRQNQFDVLPIVDPDGKINKHFATVIWNDYEELRLKNIEQSDTIYYRLSFPDLIKKFNCEHRHYYFLTNYNEILGFVSFVHLNCLVVYNYLYQIFAELEQSIANLLRQYIGQDEIVATLKRSTDKNNHALVTAFEDTVRQGSDNSIFELMYLQTIGYTLSKFYFKLPDEYHILNNYSNKFASNGVYNMLRNKIMHPIRPILNNTKTISTIDILLTDFQEIKDILRKDLLKY